MGALKFCFEAPSSLIRCVEASCRGSRVSSCRLGALKFCVEAPGFLIRRIKVLGSLL